MMLSVYDIIWEFINIEITMFDKFMIICMAIKFLQVCRPRNASTLSIYKKLHFSNLAPFISSVD